MLHDIRQDKAIRAFIRQTFNGFISLLISVLWSYLVDPSLALLLPFINSGINALSKYVNMTYFQDLWVDVKKK